MTAGEKPSNHDKPLCLGKKHMKQRPGAKTGKNPVHDAEGNELCTRPAGWGTPHPGTGRCKLHGGLMLGPITAGRRVLAEHAVVTFGLPREVDPRDALLEEVYRTAGTVDWLSRKVRELQDQDVVWGKTQEVVKDSGEFPGTDTTKSAEVNVWVRLFQQERKHLIDVCKAAVAAGLEERRVRLAEQQGALLAGVIQAILRDLNLSPEQQAKVGTVVPRHLRAVA